MQFHKLTLILHQKNPLKSISLQQKPSPNSHYANYRFYWRTQFKLIIFALSITRPPSRRYFTIRTIRAFFIAANYTPLDSLRGVNELINSDKMAVIYLFPARTIYRRELSSLACTRVGWAQILFRRNICYEFRDEINNRNRVAIVC